MNSTENDQVAESWEDLCERLYADSWSERLMRWRSPFIFRGLSDKHYPLMTALMRLGGNYHEMEYHLLRNFMKYAKIEKQYNHWKWMSIAQHHGLPTRLLDFTFSPFVALHYATDNLDKYDRDGAVWCVDCDRAHDSLPPEFKAEIKRVKSHVFTSEMIDLVARDLDELDASCKQDFVLFFEPPSLDERIVNQFAVFSVMNSPHARLDHWFEKHPELYRRIIIPRELKWEIRCKLDNANITERMLFPGLDGLACWLARHYGPTPSTKKEE